MPTETSLDSSPTLTLERVTRGNLISKSSSNGELAVTSSDALPGNLFPPQTTNTSVDKLPTTGNQPPEEVVISDGTAIPHQTLMHSLSDESSSLSQSNAPTPSLVASPSETPHQPPSVTTSPIDEEIVLDEEDDLSRFLKTSRGNNNEMNEISQYLAGRVECPRRLHRLLKVIRGSIEASQHTAAFYKALWSGSDNIFAGEASDSRLRRLYRGRKKIDQYLLQYECASRLSLLFLAHDIEVIKGRPWKLGPGQSRQFVAVLWIARHLSVSPEDIKDEWRRSQNYMRLLEKCGPGILLELGSAVNW